MHQSTVRLATILAAASLASPQATGAQEMGEETRGPRFLLASAASPSQTVPIDVGRTPVLRQRITLDLDGVTLKEALAVIAERGGLRLAYTQDVLPANGRIHLRADGITVAAALTDVLVDANVDVVFTPEGRAILKRRVAAAPLQTGTITGRVTDAATDLPLAAAEVRVVGTELGAVANDSGQYLLANVPSGQQRVATRRIGYQAQTKTVTVPDGGGTVTLDFALRAVATRLDEIVTTVTGDQRRLELGHTIGRISADSLVRTAPVMNLGDVVNARVPGAQVLLNSGYAGLSPRIQIRGANSISLNNAPLLIIDGVRVDNGSVETLSGFGQASGRLNDLNPAEIESIDIVKGPSAATLYGTDAANGVLVVTTKRGHAGAPAWTTYVEAGLIEPGAAFLDNYFSWGHSPLGDVRQCTLMQSTAGACVIDSLTVFNPLINSETTPLANGFRRQFGAQVSGGVARFRYFLAAEHERETGLLKMPAAEEARIQAERGGAPLPDEQRRPNWFDKVSLRGNVSTALGRTAEVSLSSGLVLGDLSIPSRAGVYRAGSWGRGFRDVNDGWSPFVGRPGELFAIRNEEHVTHYTGSLATSWAPLPWLSTRATAGVDLSTTALDALQRRGEGPAGVNRNGGRQNARTSIALYSADLGASAQFLLRPGLASRTSVGVQYNRRSDQRTVAAATGLAPGSETVTGAAVVSGAEQNLESIVAGGYVEQMFGVHDRLFLTAAVRADGGSSFGRDFQTALYPKGSASWLALTSGSRILSSLRLRAAYGASGVQPGSTDALALVQLVPTLMDDVTTTGAVPLTIGNPDLKPERQTELEAGVDAELFGGRVGLEATVYDRLSKDALIAAPLSSEVGIASRFENIGAVRNRGIEALLTARVVERRTLTWDVSFNGSVNRNKIEKLGLTVPFIGPDLYRNAEGYPINSRFARPILGYSDANGNGIIEAGEITVGPDEVHVGPSLPTRQLTLSTSVGLFGQRVRIGSQFDYRGGFFQVAFDEASRCFAGFLDNCRGANDPNASSFEQARAVAISTPALGSTRDGFIEDASFVRWRELSVSIDLPEPLLRSVGARNATLTLAGRNLHLFTDYTGTDPELDDPRDPNGLPDSGTAPQSRFWILRLTLGL